MGRFLNPQDLGEYSEAISDHVDDPNIFSTFIETGTAYGQSIDAVSYTHLTLPTTPYV